MFPLYLSFISLLKLPLFLSLSFRHRNWSEPDHWTRWACKCHEHCHYLSTEEGNTSPHLTQYSFAIAGQITSCCIQCLESRIIFSSRYNNIRAERKKKNDIHFKLRHNTWNFRREGNKLHRLQCSNDTYFIEAERIKVLKNQYRLSLNSEHKTDKVTSRVFLAP